MLMVSVTFVQATFDLTTFVHISNISAVTAPILTNFKGRILGTCLSDAICPGDVWTQYFWRPTIHFFEPTFFPKSLLDSNVLAPELFWTLGSFNKSFWNSKLFQTENGSDPKFFLDTNFVGQKFCWTQILLDQKYFWTQIFFNPNSLGSRSF